MSAVGHMTDISAISSTDRSGARQMGRLGWFDMEPGNTMADDLRPQPGILDIALYKGGGASLAGHSNVVKLSSNENPWGAPDSAREAVSRVLHELHRYPATDHAALRAAIAETHGLNSDRIVCGNGSGEVLALLCQAYAGVGDELIYTEHGFSMYPIYARSIGATPVVAPERERVVDVDAILGLVTKRTRMVLIANPANPTGTMIGQAEMAHLADALPSNVMLVLDGAYAEFVEGYDGGASLVERHQNVVMTRTFSKIYGLSGMRIGWAYAPGPVIDVINRIRGPFNLSAPALAAAEAAVRDRDFVTKIRAENQRLRDWLAGALMEHGVPSDHSMANFILARFGSVEEAQACDAHLRNEGIIVRQVGGYGLPHCLRITVGDEPSCRRVAHAIGTFKEATA